MYDIIINPVAGKGKSLKILKKAEKLLKEKDADYTLHYTEYKNNATEIVKELNKKDNTNLLVFGGDGTFNEVLNGIENFDTMTVGFIPCGTGNDFVRATSISSNINENIETILSNNTKYIDYIQLDTVRALNIAGTGMDVDTLIAYSKIKFFKGKTKYYIALLKTLLNLKFHKLELTIDGETSIHEVFMIGIGNGSHIGGGMPICPESKPDDGLLDIVLINKIKPSKVFPLLLKFLKGKHINEPCTESYRAKEVSLNLLPEENEIAKTQVDGEVFDSESLNCELISNKLKIFSK